MDEKIYFKMAKEVGAFFERSKKTPPAIKSLLSTLLKAKMDTLNHRPASIQAALSALNDAPGHTVDLVTFETAEGVKKTVLYF